METAENVGRGIAWNATVGRLVVPAKNLGFALVPSGLNASGRFADPAIVGGKGRGFIPALLIPPTGVGNFSPPMEIHQLTFLFQQISHEECSIDDR